MRLRSGRTPLVIGSSRFEPKYLEPKSGRGARTEGSRGAHARGDLRAALGRETHETTYDSSCTRRTVGRDEAGAATPRHQAQDEHADQVSDATRVAPVTDTGLPPLSPQLPPELALLTVLDLPNAVADLSQRVDWPTVTGLARHHRLTGLLATALHNQGDPQEPVATIAAQLLDEQQRLRARYTTEILPQLDEACTALLSAEIVPTLLKGAALIATGIYDAGERPMADLDVLVDRAEVERASIVLRELGYRSLTTKATRAWAREHHYQDPAWRHAAHPLPIEIHWGLQVPGHRLAFDVASLQRSTLRLPSGTRVRCLAAEEQVTHLSLHFWHDRLHGLPGALGQLWDVRRVSPSFGDSQWAVIAERARNRGHAHALAAVLACSTLLLGGEPPRQYPDVARFVADERCRSFAIRRVLASRPRHIQLVTVTPDVPYSAARVATRLLAQVAKPLDTVGDVYGAGSSWRLRVRHLRAVGALLRRMVRSPLDTASEISLDRWAHRLA
jgi:hypothetical protein